jgi:hypothetical protein
MSSCCCEVLDITVTKFYWRTVRRVALFKRAVAKVDLRMALADRRDIRITQRYFTWRGVRRFNNVDRRVKDAP